VVAVLVFAIVADRGAVDIIGDVAVVLVPAIIASAPSLARPVRAAFAVFGLAVCCELLVAYSGGANDVDILILLTVVVAALCRSWQPFLLSVGMVAIHFGIVAIAAIRAASGDPDALADVWTFVGLRCLYLVGAALVGLIGWRLGDANAADTDDATADLTHTSTLDILPAPMVPALSAETSISRRSQALVDPLTGLPNRLGFMRPLTDAWQRSSDSRALAVVVLDIDRFKVIKGSLGHEMGDSLLVAVGDRLSRQIGADRRPGRYVARSLADLFMLLFEDVQDLAEATREAESIVAAIAEPFRLSGREVTTTASVGVAIAEPGPGRVGPDELVRRADVALYTAKLRGRRTVGVYDPSSDAMTPEQIALEADLHHAIERRELLVYCQPLVRLSDGGIRGLEALLRWRHPRLGMIPPDRFIPIAEDTGLIVPLGRWVLRQAAFQAAAWRRHLTGNDSLHLSVNVSPVELRHPAFPDSVADTLRASGLPASALTLEITESALVGNFEAHVLTAVHQQGIRLAIDDFGTGYSSLSYLHRLPASVLKIDRAFVTSMEADSGSALLVQAVIAIARSLGMTVTAEGIESTRQRDLLRAAGCDYGQGYLFGPPLPIHKVEQLIVGHEPTDLSAVATRLLAAQEG
jgi:diguanylate cyclase (GGDEF)-like protein